MNDANAYRAFLNLAEDLVVNRKTKRDLARVTAQLPPVTHTLLKHLGNRAEEFATHQPRYGWAVTKIAYRASVVQKQDVYVRSLAAWYLGRASNHWGQPRLVKQAISQARRGFLKLNEMGWVAACDWQYNILSWTRPNIPHAVATLQHALETLQETGFDEFVPHCRAALAYAQLLIGRFDDARENIRICETSFIETDDELNRARCWLNQASCYRREGRVREALKKLEEASAIFEREHALIDSAKAYYQIGLCRLMIAEDLPEAIEQFNKASDLFSANDMDLWNAACINNLGYVFSLLGSLEKADQCYSQARTSFIHHQVLSLLADNLNDNGKLNAQRGNLKLSIEQYKKAEGLHEQIGMKQSAAVDTANLGEAYGLVGRYQDALHHLERAVDFFKSINNRHRLHSSEKFIALIWSQLGQFDEALNHLDKAADYDEKGNQNLTTSSIHNYRASIFFKQQEYAKALHHLTLSLEAAIRDGLRPQAALAKRLLGEALFQTQQDTNALDYLMEAYSDFSDMGMVMDQAFTLVALGTYFAQVSRLGEAETAFENALQLSHEAMPEIEWRAHAGLAYLAEIKSDENMELSSYRYAMTALTKIRQNFWQPGLAGSYLQTPIVMFDKAIRRAAEMHANEDTLQFVEVHKAATLVEQLKTEDIFVKNKKTKELMGLRSEIIWLQDKMRVSFESNKGVKSELESRQLRSRLSEKVRLYDSEMARLERRNYSKEPLIPLWDTFAISQFRDTATDTLGESWAALDFYITNDKLITITITPQQYTVQSTLITQRIDMALQMISLSRQHAKLLQSDLLILGDFLIPTSLAESLTPNTYLLLAPHKRLHSVPWAAIQPSATSRPLVSSCIPVLIPSLFTFCVLAKRGALQERQSKRGDGLILGLSTFRGYHPELPHVKDEVTALATKLGPGGRLLTESDATWDKLREALSNKRLDRHNVTKKNFDWLHLASHIFVDSHTGRTSGIVLQDRDVWVDELRDLATMPRLVIFSACNSIFSFVYEGDEHMDIPATCFIAGASTIVGSARRILDSAASDFSTSFYEYYLNGLGPAQSVAQTQRRMIRQDRDIESWASFSCMGVP